MKLPLCLFTLTAACAGVEKKPVPPGGDPRLALVTEIAAARLESEKLLVEQSAMAWRNWVLGDPLDLAKPLLGHAALFSKETVSKVRALEALTADPRERRALQIFRVYLSGEIVARETAELSDQVGTLEAVATFNGADGVEHPYRELERLTANERDHQKRVALYDAALPVVDRLTPLLEQKEAITLKVLPDLGYPSYVSYAAELREADLAALGSQAETVLDQTEGVYRINMDRALRTELGLALADARRADISRFNRSVDLDAAFPADKMMARLRETLLGMGFDLSRQPGIRIDDAALPSKNPRAVCFDVKVPGDIRLSVKPVGGLSDYRALFHEAGHAEDYANVTTPVFEFRQLGDGAPTEAYAFVFESLLANPLWLADHTSLSEAKIAELVRAAAVKQLYLLRRCAGRLLFEFAWHAGFENPAAKYQAILGRAYSFAVTPDDARRYLVDHDDFFSSADYFRAWFLAAQIQARLAKEAGPRWWTSPKTGALLRSLWADGNALTVDDIAKRLGDPALELHPLLAQFTEVLVKAP